MTSQAIHLIGECDICGLVDHHLVQGACLSCHQQFHITTLSSIEPGGAMAIQLHTRNVEQPLKILNNSLRERLDLANAAHRALSVRGYSIIRQALRRDTKKPPLLILARGDEELRAYLTQIYTATSDDGCTIVGRFMDVDVTWVQP